jgi:hypothetical protein
MWSAPPRLTVKLRFALVRSLGPGALAPAVALAGRAGPEGAPAPNTRHTASSHSFHLADGGRRFGRCRSFRNRAATHGRSRRRIRMPILHFASAFGSRMTDSKKSFGCRSGWAAAASSAAFVNKVFRPGPRSPDRLFSFSASTRSTSALMAPR